eukprot:gnl/TRDRNA2_/TRDRNA2_91674_c0_seq1.p1 gnl/TRDRNA2_/TRDRNA2_91674_c0~~gnl/TRDRNA2_/TRDRNA2_91674_c0_seq1.p1  ORF type:complete len:250 (-),score=37.35 gnl/TRDRNA2_/TRDRNA2_91674_c0_seq1:108-857(-)
MVVPIGDGGLGPPAMIGPPPTQAIRLLPWLRVTVFGVLLAVVGEIVAEYWNEAIFDLLTLAVALPTVQDVNRLGNCILCLALIAAFNSVSDVVNLVMILAGYRLQLSKDHAHLPDYREFFALQCEYENGETKEVFEVCTWRTFVGDCCIVFAILMQILCFQVSRAIFKAYRAEWQGDDNFLDRNPMPLPNTGVAPEAQAEAGGAPALAGANTQQAVRGAAGRGPGRGLAGAHGPPGFTPFSGQGHSLAD